tara:strand:- start:3594 stop:4355 length:762 start_codon:yes stop_codon:yes gene_type:complete
MSILNEDLPNVSILTPTWKRANFIPLMINNLKYMDYPKDKLEQIIIDDVPDIADKLFITEQDRKNYEQEIGIPVRYYYKPQRHLSIGEKRNMLVKHAKYKTLICMDDDDVYVPTYIRYSINALLSQKKIGIVCSPQMLFVFPNQDYKLTGIQCPSKRQGHEATMCFTIKHFRSMGGFVTRGVGEGAKMVDFNEKSCLKTQCEHCMICVCHDFNTVDKDRFSKDDSEQGIINIDGKIDDTIKKIIQQCVEKRTN